MNRIDVELKKKQIKELKSLEKIVDSKGDPNVSKLLSKRQRFLKKNNPSKFEVWFWNQSYLTTGLIVTIVFITLSYISNGNTLLSLILNSIEPLSVLLAVMIFIKETPERKKQYNYQALSTIDSASGIKNSKARIVALQDLVDEGINLDELDLNNANLEGIEINGVEIKKGIFTGANLSDAVMHLANLQKGEFSNVYAPSFQIRFGNLSFSNFKQSNFSNADFSNSNLMFANFEDANLSGAKFRNAKLRGAKFKGAYLNGADFKGASIDLNSLKKGKLENAILPNGEKYKSNKV
tara:strand:- start:146 stop:1027 length:882 start_codon:yes stop_codon:yes gene_type:complete